jgi:MFS family permease
VAWPTAFRTLATRNFRLFLSGQIISLIGTWMQMIAEAWLVYRLTGSSALLGAVGFANQMPACLLGPLGGIAADRFNRHHVIVLTQTVSMLLAFTLAGLTLTGWIQIWHVFVLATLLGTVNAFDIPARQAFVVDMVGRADVVNAIALNSSTFNAARMLGPAVAGAMVALVGEGWCFFINGVSFLAVIAVLLAMRLEAKEIAPRTVSAFAHLAEGFQFCWHHKLIRPLLLLVAVVSLLAFPFTVLMPIFADQILHGGPRGYGILTGASGVGSLAGGMVLATRHTVIGLQRWTGGFTAIGGLALLLFGVSEVFWLSFALLVITGTGLMLGIGSANTLIQDAAPDALRGRVTSIYAMAFLGMTPIGSLLAGLAAEQVGAPLTVVAGGAVTTASALLFAWQGRRGRQAKRP